MWNWVTCSGESTFLLELGCALTPLGKKKNYIWCGVLAFFFPTHHFQSQMTVIKGRESSWTIISFSVVSDQKHNQGQITGHYSVRWIKLDVKITWKPMLAQKHIHMQYRDNIGKKKIIYTVCVFIADFLKQINNKWLFELEKISLVPVNCVLTKCNHLFLIPAQHQGFLGPVLFLWKLYHSFQFSFYLTTMHISIKSFAQLAYKCITVILHFIFI